MMLFKHNPFMMIFFSQTLFFILLSCGQAVEEGANSNIKVLSDTTYHIDSLNLDPGVFYYYLVLVFNGIVFPKYSLVIYSGILGGVIGKIFSDHRIVSDYEFIPQSYIDDIKKILLNITGDSHSHGYRPDFELFM